ncbi:hypothetical protein [Thiomonas sp.]
MIRLWGQPGLREYQRYLAFQEQSRLALEEWDRAQLDLKGYCCLLAAMRRRHPLALTAVAHGWATRQRGPEAYRETDWLDWLGLALESARKAKLPWAALEWAITGYQAGALPILPDTMAAAAAAPRRPRCRQALLEILDVVIGHPGYAGHRQQGLMLRSRLLGGARLRSAV